MLAGFSGIVNRRSQKGDGNGNGNGNATATSPTSASSSSNLTISPPSNPVRGSAAIQQQQMAAQQRQQSMSKANSSIASPTSISSNSPSRPYHHPQPMLPEELTARERLREREREKERDREKERFERMERERSQRERERERERTQRSIHSGDPNPNPNPNPNPPPRSSAGLANSASSSNHMESSVTRLLVATKLLLESLTKWSLGQRSETQVSDIYVRLGNDFNTARIAFGSYGIDMSDLLSVPDDLRVCLERCLSEEASPQVLEVHLPRIREIIINLLQGLKLKQAQYKQFLLQQRNDRRRESVLSSNSNANAGGSSLLNRENSVRSNRDNGNVDLNRKDSSSTSNFKRSSRSTRQGISESKDIGSGFINSSNTQALEPSLNSRPESLQRGTSNGVLPSSISSATVRPDSIPSNPNYNAEFGVGASMSRDRDSRRPIASPKIDEDPASSSQRASVGKASATATATPGIVRPPSRNRNSGSNHERTSLKIQSESLNEALPSRNDGETHPNSNPNSNSLRRNVGGSMRSDYSDKESSSSSSSSSPSNARKEVVSRFTSSEDEVEQTVQSDKVPENVVRHSLVDEGPSKVPTLPSFEIERETQDSNPGGDGTVMESTDRSTKAIPSSSSRSRKIQEINSSNSFSNLPSSFSSSNSLALPKDPTSPSPNTSLTVDSDPSLRALKSRDALERRASKRFSAYTFNKMGIGSGFAQIGMSSLSGGGNNHGNNSGSATTTPTHTHHSHGNSNLSPKLESGKKSLPNHINSHSHSPENRSSLRKNGGNAGNGMGRGSGNQLLNNLGDQSIGEFSNSPARSVAIRRGLEKDHDLSASGGGGGGGGGGLSSLDESPIPGPSDSPSDSRNGSRSSSFSGKKSPRRSLKNLEKESGNNHNETGDSLLAPEITRKGSTTSSDHSASFVDANDGDDRIEDRIAQESKLDQAEREGEEGEEEKENNHDNYGTKIPPVPPLPTTEEREKLDFIQNSTLRPSSSSSTSSSSNHAVQMNERSSKTPSSSIPSTPRIPSSQRINSTSMRKTSHVSNSNHPHLSKDPDQLTLFLQLGRQTKKTILDLRNSDLSIVRLRMLFIDKFAYSPGMDDFPTICIKHVESGVVYELEDLDDVVDGAVLTLNIEPLDQVKQHLDLSLGVITRELRDLKATVNERRSSRNFSTEALSAAAAAAVQAQVQALGLSASSPSSGGNPAAQISDSQFAAAGQRVAQLKKVNTNLRSTGGSGGGEEDSTIHSPALSNTSMTSSTIGSAGAKVASELKSQYDEVQNLRREFAILKQIQHDFGSDISSIIKGVREQSSKVRAIAASEVPAERNFIIAGKARLDSGSQEVLTLVEDLQDTVDDLKLDVIQRGVKPKISLMKSISSDIEKATKGLEDLENYVRTVKPSWKKTWENELQNIVDEQEFLNHQESLLADLRDDNDALQEVFQNIQQVVKLRGPVKSNSNLGSSSNGFENGGQSGNPLTGITLQRFIPPPPEEGHEGLDTVMLEVKSQSVDHEKRLRALQAAERLRAKELASKSDEFQDELKGFVDKKALRKTGGHVEAERVRQRRDKATINAMFGGGGVGGAPANAGNGAEKSEKPKKFILGRDAKSKEESSRPTETESEEHQQSG